MAGEGGNWASCLGGALVRAAKASGDAPEGGWAFSLSIFGHLAPKTRKVVNRLATALRVAAQALWRAKNPMGDLFRSYRLRLGMPKAITPPWRTGSPASCSS